MASERNTASGKGAVEGKPRRGVGAWTKEKAKRTQDYSAGRIAWWVLLVVIGFAINTALGKALRWWDGPDEFLAKMYAEQTSEFEKLQTGLGELRKELPAGQTSAFDTVQSAVSSLRESNSALMNQLSEAKRRNKRLSENLAAAGSAQGGYDFLLEEGGGIRVDDTTYVGLRSINGFGAAGVNLTSKDDARQQTSWLDPGEAISYEAANGEACKVVVLSIDRSAETVTFDTTCIESSAT